MKRKLVGVATALVLVLGVSVGAAEPVSAAYANGNTWAYNDAGYLGGLAVSFTWGSTGDCNAYPGFIWYPGLYARQRISSLNVNVGGRSHCNALYVRSGAAGQPYVGKCISHNDSGIGSLGAPWNDNVDAIVLVFKTGCGLY
jgi:hypothetical protein